MQTFFVIALIFLVENFIDAKPTALGEFNGNSGSDGQGLSVIPLPSNSGIESFGHPIRIRESFNQPPNYYPVNFPLNQNHGIAPGPAIPFHRNKRALVFRPLFVYRQQQIRRERLGRSTLHPTPYRSTSPIYKYD
jgi:hypothetical protein